MQLVDIDSISPSTYNPREADAERLKYIEYSLRKLGFLLPLYVCEKTGEILSGRQRHYVSKQMGLKQVPVQFVKPMSLERRKAYKDKFQGNDRVAVKYQDVTKGLQYENVSLALSILSIQFTPIEYRQRIIQSIYDSLNEGGAFIFVEKVLGDVYEIDNHLVSEYYHLKMKHGYSNKQIAAKKKSLEGVLVPLTFNWNSELLHKAGFKKVDCFWRYLNFAGFVAIK